MLPTKPNTVEYSMTSVCVGIFAGFGTIANYCGRKAGAKARILECIRYFTSHISIFLLLGFVVGYGKAGSIND